MRCFKTDKDGRFTAESQIYDYQMKLMKSYDNSLKPEPETSPHGYIRTFAASVTASPGTAGPVGAATLFYADRIKIGNELYSVTIYDNGDGTSSPIFTRTA